jgi:hypothetical protein
LHILGHVALKLAALAGALGGKRRPRNIMLALSNLQAGARESSREPRHARQADSGAMARQKENKKK